MTKLPLSLRHLIQLLKKLPGIGTKTAERFAFQLLEWEEEPLKDLGQLVQTLKESIQFCTECRAMIAEKECPFCQNPQRDKTLCIVAHSKDLFPIEQTHSFQGLYHVLGSLLSPLEGKTIPEEVLQALCERIKNRQIQEVILALDSTLEGEATSLFLKEILEKLPVRVFRLAFGIPLGTHFESVDEGTLAKAFFGKQPF